MKYWLMKSEPDAFSLDDLKAAPNMTEGWDGIRNYQARNFMRDDFSINDKVLFYHSRIAKPAIVGLAVVVSDSYPDLTALDPKEKYYDEKSAKLGESRWVMLDIKFVKEFKTPITLEFIKNHSELKTMNVAKRGMRLSIQPVDKKHYTLIKSL